VLPDFPTFVITDMPAEIENYVSNNDGSNGKKGTATTFIVQTVEVHLLDKHLLIEKANRAAEALALRM
jgi:hypothetical protein